MRHRVAGRKFGLPSDQRRALLKGLLRALIKHGEIQTTETRAKEIRSVTEKVITIAKTNDLHSRRQARRWLNDEDMVKVLFDDVAPKYTERPGGYTRMTKIGFRRGDAAPMVKIELVSD
ncbi:MAG TPA: 50S ribosomal protein L17 [Armatimonadota bacterium]|jgi:large subunit ribosomal protein L17|nr:50S ribosomal protein L17 [Armatimonadota bacterium]